MSSSDRAPELVPEPEPELVPEPEPELVPEPLPGPPPLERASRCGICSHYRYSIGGCECFGFGVN